MLFVSNVCFAPKTIHARDLNHHLVSRVLEEPHLKTFQWTLQSYPRPMETSIYWYVFEPFQVGWKLSQLKLKEPKEWLSIS
jgi:hypothetical protein